MLGEAEVAHVILVDDEPMVLSALSSLIALETAYAAVPFSRAADALAYLTDGHAANVIISDILMPQMDGLAFLSRARVLRPEVPRMILSGYAKRTDAIAAMEQSGAFTQMEKPWNNQVLLTNIRNGIGLSAGGAANRGRRRDAFA